MKKLPPADEAEAGRAFYAEIAPDLEVSHFATLWHVLSLGHLVATDLDRIARSHGFSSADLHLLGLLRVARGQRLRATDLAHSLHVSNAALSARVLKLVRHGLLLREPSPADRRAFELTLTTEGTARTDAAIADISRNSQFARRHLRLSEEDRAAVGRVLGQLHDMMDRDFIPAMRRSC